MNIEKREKIEWLNYWIEDANKDKDRVILLGDSVTRELRKKLNIFMEEMYAVDLMAMSYSILDDMALEEIKHFFEKNPYQYVSIIYQMGAHHGYHLECVGSGNDAKQFECRTREILKVLSRYSNKVIAISPTLEREIDKNGKSVLHHNVEIGKRNQILRDVSKELQISFLDLNKEMDYQKIRFSDWCHFYEDCYEYIAEVIIKHFFSDIEYVSSNRMGTFEELNEKLRYYKNKKIYIYGNGVRGNRIKMYLKRKGYTFNGFIVSKQYADQNEDVLVVDQVEREDTLIIVTPMDASIWKELDSGKFDYISLNSYIYTCLELGDNEDWGRWKW